MSTGDHFIHRFYDNCLETAQGNGMRVAVLEIDRKNTTLSEWSKQNPSGYSSYAYRSAALFFNTQIATSLSARRGAWLTY
jgi:hypothetical protein